MQALAVTLPRRLLENTLLSLVASALMRGSLATQRAVLQLDFHTQLRAAASLAAYLCMVVPAVLSVLVGDDRAADVGNPAPSAAPQVSYASRLPAPGRNIVSQHLALHARSCSISAVRMWLAGG